MALVLTFELRLEERCTDRVVVSVLLSPAGGTPRIDGVALQMITRTGEPIGIRMLLPISGELHQPMLSTVELKAADGIPAGTRVVGTAWQGADQREAIIPTDPFTELEVHIRARRRLGSLPGSQELEPLTTAERAVIAKDFPWVEEPRLPAVADELAILESEDTGHAIDDLVENLGLDEDSAEWLKELLEEEEDQAVE